MPTACGNVSIEFSSPVSGVGDLFFMSKAMFIENWYDLRNIGASRGSDIPLPGVDGVLQRGRARNDLRVTLEGMFFNGRWTEDNEINCDTAWPEQARAYLNAYLAFFVSGASRGFTVTITEFGTSYSGSATFLEPGSISWPLPYVAETSALLSIPLGVLETTP